MGGGVGGEEGGENQVNLLGVAGEELWGRECGGREVCGEIVEGSQGDLFIGMVRGGDLGETGEGYGGAGFGCPGTGAGGEVLLFGGLVVGGICKECVWAGEGVVFVVVVEMDHGVVLKVVADARKIMADGDIERGENVG